MKESEEACEAMVRRGVVGHKVNGHVRPLE